MVEVFKTNVTDKNQATKLVGILYQQFPECRINFDLDDCDKVLRVEGANGAAEHIRTIVNEHGFRCEMLE